MSFVSWYRGLSDDGIMFGLSVVLVVFIEGLGEAVCSFCIEWDNYRSRKGEVLYMGSGLNGKLRGEFTVPLCIATAEGGKRQASFT